MVVEDSAVVRTLLCRLIEQDPRLRLAGAVESAEEALAVLPRLKPDVISMDVHLPGMDGLVATREIMARQPTPIVIVSDAWSGGTAAKAGLTMEALRSGALTVIEKPRLSAIVAGDLARGFTTQLSIMSQVPVVRRRLAPPPSAVMGPTCALGGRPVRLLVMAASTGGPPAFERVLRALPADFPLPIVLVQHMGAPFLDGFASWLDGLVGLDVRLARPGDMPRPGLVLVAPGDGELRLGAGGVVRIDPVAPGARPGPCPSADLLFHSAVERFGASVMGVLLTGMGRDGASGLAAIHRAGGPTIAEDARTAVVFGMPRAAIEMNAASLVLPLDLIAGSLCATAGVPVPLAGAAVRSGLAEGSPL
ncbi:response regulator [Ameyamaea chiangmaiensis]|nr:chemotaxis protein CheB [Ameyamaea chiangmaiensis]MBS4074466.1 response regulator [Ameyamaea chiangmaiensis]